MCCAWQQIAQCSAPFQSAMRRSSRAFFPCIAVNTTILLTYFQKVWDVLVFNILHITLCFYSTYLYKMLKFIPFGSQAWQTPQTPHPPPKKKDTLVISLRLYAGKATDYILNAFFQVIFSVRIITTYFKLQYAIRIRIARLQIRWKRRNSVAYSVTKCTQATTHRIVSVVQKWCQNVSDVWTQ